MSLLFSRLAPSSSIAIRSRTSSVLPLSVLSVRLLSTGAPQEPNRFAKWTRAPVRTKERVRTATPVKSSALAPAATTDLATEQTTESNMKALEVMQNTAGLPQHMTKVFKTTGIGLMVSSAACALAMPLAATSFWVPALGGLVMSLGGSFAMHSINPTFKRLSNGFMISDNPINRKLASGAVFAGMGAMLSPLVTFLAASGQAAVLPQAMILSAATMGGAYLFALNKPSGSMLKYGPALTGGLVGLIALSLANALIFKSTALMGVGSVVSIGIFSVLTAFDTHTAIKDYEAGIPDHLSHAVNFFLNFSNLFGDFARLLGLSGMGNPAPVPPVAGAGEAAGSMAGSMGGAVPLSGDAMDMSSIPAGEFMSDTAGEASSMLGDVASAGSGFFEGMWETVKGLWDFFSDFFRD